MAAPEIGVRRARTARHSVGDTAGFPTVLEDEPAAPKALATAWGRGAPEGPRTPESLLSRAGRKQNRGVKIKLQAAVQFSLLEQTIRKKPGSPSPGAG